MSGQMGTCVVCKKPAKLRCSACHTIFYCDGYHQKEDWRNHKKVCLAYEVKFSEGAHFVVAARNIKKNEAIVEETPFVFGPNYVIEEIGFCPGCHRRQELRSRCPRCDWPICGLKCPGMTEPTRHGIECAILSKIKHSTFRRSSDVILPLRCLLLQKTDPKKWNIFFKMAAIAQAITTSSGSNESMYVLQEFILKPLARVAPEALPDCSVDTVGKVYAMLNVYGLDLHAPQFGHLIAVCKVSSLMEHSCVPNARRLVDIPPIDERNPTEAQLRCRVIMRAVKDIRKGENITTLFMDTWMSTWARQVSLMSRRKVHCKCARCLDPRELGTNFGTLKCSVGRCGGWVLPMDTLKIDTSDWKCEACGKIYPFYNIMTLLIRLKDEMDGYRVAYGRSTTHYEALLKYLQTWLHPNHHYCLLVKARLFNYHAAPLLAGLGGKLMTDAQLHRAAELCEEVLRVMNNPAIVTQQLGKISECLSTLALTNMEIVNRKMVSGECTGAQACNVMAECQEVIKRAARLQYSQFDVSSANERMPIEVIEKMSAITLFLSRFVMTNK